MAKKKDGTIDGAGLACQTPAAEPKSDDRGHQLSPIAGPADKLARCTRPARPMNESS